MNTDQNNDTDSKAPEPKLPFPVAKALLWVAGVGVVLGVVAQLLGLFESFWPEPGCGESTFVARSEYHSALSRYTQNFHRDTELTKEDLYNSNAEPRHVGDALIESSNELSALANAIKTDAQYASADKMIFLYGASGTGKSTVISRLRDLSDIAFFDVGEHFKYVQATNTTHPDTTMENQLVYKDAVISWMPKITDAVLSRKTRLEEFFLKYNRSPLPQSVQTTIIDSLDEIHPISATRIIDCARDFLRCHPGKNVILSGRGETFRDFFEKEAYRKHDFQPIHVAPLYVGEEPLLSWYAAQSLWYEKNEMKGPAPTSKEVERRVANVTALLNSKPILRNFMITLAPANFVYSHIDYKGEENLVELLFHRLVQRNRRKHYRPTGPKGEHWELYKAAITQVARIARIREDGSFILPVQQNVEIDYGGNCVAVNAKNTLNMSGLIDLCPFDKDHLEYTFFPLPLHELLAEFE